MKSLLFNREILTLTHILTTFALTGGIYALGFLMLSPHNRPRHIIYGVPFMAFCMMLVL